MSRGEEGNYQSGRERGSVKVGTGGSLVLGLKLGQMLGSYNSNLESAKWKGEKFKIKGWLKTGIGEVCGKYMCLSEYHLYFRVPPSEYKCQNSSGVVPSFLYSSFIFFTTTGMYYYDTMRVPWRDGGN